MPSQVAGLLEQRTDVLGEKPMRFLRKIWAVRHSDIMVVTIMTAQSELEVLHIGDVKKASVGNIIASLKQSWQNSMGWC